jgi:hypothetical protein
MRGQASQGRRAAGATIPSAAAAPSSCCKRLFPAGLRVQEERSACLPARTDRTAAGSRLQVAVLERPAGPTTLEFAGPEAPESAGPSIFPAELQLRFQEPEAEAAAAAAPAADVAAPPSQSAVEAPAEAPEGGWEAGGGVFSLAQRSLG